MTRTSTYDYLCNGTPRTVTTTTTDKTLIQHFRQHLRDIEDDEAAHGCPESGATVEIAEIIEAIEDLEPA